MIVKYLSSVT